MRRYIEAQQNDFILARSLRGPGRGNMDMAPQQKQTHQTKMPVAQLFRGSPCPERQRQRQRDKGATSYATLWQYQYANTLT